MSTSINFQITLADIMTKLDPLTQEGNTFRLDAKRKRMSIA